MCSKSKGSIARTPPSARLHARARHDAEAGSSARTVTRDTVTPEGESLEREREREREINYIGEAAT
jgi:hypothetical protein